MLSFVLFNNSAIGKPVTRSGLMPLVTIYMVPGDCDYCSCSDWCYKRGDCCPDGNHRDYENLQCLDVQVWNTHTHDGIEAYLLKASCPLDADPELRQKCTGTGSELLPVYSRKTHLSYKNVFCAKCNYLNDTTAQIVPWEMRMKCVDLLPNSVESLVEECMFVYTPGVFMKDRKCTKHDFSQEPVFGRCNMTGLWATFDSDIEFGCRRFNHPYGIFKNVFCYICNPSESSLKVKYSPIIDRCKLHDSHDVTFYNKLVTLCRQMGSMERLLPFKNIYCKMCNPKYFLFKNKTGSIHIKSVSKSLTNIRTNLHEITIPALSNNVTETLRLMVELIARTQFVTNTSFQPEASSYNLRGRANITKMIKQYSSVCGFTQICNSSYIDSNEDLPEYSLCPPCQCKDDCITSRFPCCFDKLLERDFYQCRYQSTFLSSTFFKPREPVNSQPQTSKLFGLVSECPEKTDPVLKSRCSRERQNETNILKRVPVLLKDSSTALKNIYCLDCHTGLRNDIAIYLKFECSMYFEGFLFQSFEDLIDAANEFKCNIAFTLDDDKLCSGSGDHIDGLVAHCNVTGLWQKRDADIKEACENTDHYGLMNRNFYPYQLQVRQYKNPFCALCNQDFFVSAEFVHDGPFEGCIDDAPDTVKELCYTKPKDPWWGTYANVFCHACFWDVKSVDKNLSREDITFVKTGKQIFFSGVHLSYRSLFSVRLEEVEALKTEMQRTCIDGSFDHEKAECVNVYCSSERKLQNGKCVNLFESMSDITYYFNIDLKLKHESDDRTVKDDQTKQDVNLTSEKVNETHQDIVVVEPFSICQSISENIKAKLKNVDHDTNTRIRHCTVLANRCRTDLTNKTMDEYSQKVFLVDDRGVINVRLTLILHITTNRTVFENVLIGLMNDEYVIDGIKYVEQQTDIDRVQIANTRCVRAFNLSVNTLSRTRSLILSQSSECPMLQFLANSDMLFDQRTGDLLVHNGSTRIGPTNYVFTEQNNRAYVRICKAAVTWKYNITSHKGIVKIMVQSALDLVYLVFSSGCTALSLLGLYFTFMTYCVFKELRTVPGKNNMHLSLCLFIAQCGMLYSLNLVNQLDSLVCKITGIIVHFFWLATFCAMNVCSFHMFQVFVAKTMYTQSTPSQRSRRAIKYALYIYLIPLTAVLCIIIVKIVRSNNTDIGYGVSKCFINDFIYLVLGFLVPTGIITFVNIVFYTLTFYTLCISPTLQSTNQDRQNLIIYAKLCSITGVLWPLVFVDAFFELSAFSFFVTFVNGLQGTFMFLSFVCNRRVLKMYRNLGKGPSIDNTERCIRYSSKVTDTCTRYALEKSSSASPRMGMRNDIVDTVDTQ